jgi:methylenetetrahydrofolate dehydrogenase (NADP+) / methenyltetrahydrofolate cyclohydrolase
MSAQIIDGKAIGQVVRQSIAVDVAALKARGITPGLAVIIVGEDAASQVYVRNKVAACAEVGMHSILERQAVDLTQAGLLKRIAELNQDATIHGILVQLPLPKHIDEKAVLAAISPDKDVDGFHAENSGALMAGAPRFIPCTPYGCMQLLSHIGVDLKGKHAVVVGRSNIVGKPMAMLLLNAHATVTICHSHTANLAEICRQADILVAAVGRANFITGEMVKPGAVVLDVGINRVDGKLVGDVDFTSVSPQAGWITPVPGGVGPMTITMLLKNTLLSASR